MTDEQVQRVAKAIYAADEPGAEWPDNETAYMYRDMARAAIAALTVTPQEAAKVLLADRVRGYGNRAAMAAMWDYVHEKHGRHMLPQSHYDGVLQAALRAISEDSQ